MHVVPKRLTLNNEQQITPLNQAGKHKQSARERHRANESFLVGEGKSTLRHPVTISAAKTASQSSTCACTHALRVRAAPGMCTSPPWTRVQLEPGEPSHGKEVTPSQTNRAVVVEHQLNLIDVFMEGW